jgi:hypothetical protein
LIAIFSQHLPPAGPKEEAFASSPRFAFAFLLIFYLFVTQFPAKSKTKENMKDKLQVQSAKTSTADNDCITTSKHNTEV